MRLLSSAVGVFLGVLCSSFNTSAGIDGLPLVCAPPLPAALEQKQKKDRFSQTRTPILRERWITYFHTHTHEAIALPRDEVVSAHPEQLEILLRDRVNWQRHHVDPRTLDTVHSACVAVGGERIEIVSGYRSDKLNEQLRKKGHQVASHSQHTEGNAVDFRVLGVPLVRLVSHLRRTHQGGLGVYRQSDFVHVDTGPVRTWRGQ